MCGKYAMIDCRSEVVKAPSYKRLTTSQIQSWESLGSDQAMVMLVIQQVLANGVLQKIWSLFLPMGLVVPGTRLLVVTSYHRQASHPVDSRARTTMCLPIVLSWAADVSEKLTHRPACGTRLPTRLHVLLRRGLALAPTCSRHGGLSSATYEDE